MSLREPSTFTAEERLDRVDVLLFAIFCLANYGSSRADDPDNVDASSTMASMARDEIKKVEDGLTAFNAMDADCGA